jgi:hypothetical protein
MKTEHLTIATVVLLLAGSIAATASTPTPIMTVPLGPADHVDSYMSEAPCPPGVCAACFLIIALWCGGGHGACVPAEGWCYCEIYECHGGAEVDRIMVSPGKLGQQA